MCKHGDALGRLDGPRLDEFSQPEKQHVYIERAVRLLRLVFAHLERAMAQGHDPPGQPAQDGVDSVKVGRNHGLCEKLDPPKS